MSPAQRAVYLVGFALLRQAQHGMCPMCRGALPETRQLGRVSLDHVWPSRLLRGGAMDRPGNAMLVHQKCNNRKGGRLPNGCELIWLFVINRRLGLMEEDTTIFDGTETSNWRIK